MTAFTRIGRSQTLVAVLAAGKGRRFGENKLLAPCCGMPVVAWALKAIDAAGFEPGVLVCRPLFAAKLGVATEWSFLEVQERQATPLSHSIGLAVGAAQHLGAESLLVCLADMPLVEPDHLKRVGTCEGVAATIHEDGGLGVPARFPASYYPRLLELRGDQGAGKLLRGLTDITRCAAPTSTLLDVDTPDDIRTAENILACRGSGDRSQ
ncbi:MAG: hypothetical protein DCO98_03940 [Altererythrobacter sp. XM-24bin4]|uniref:nucleotidyltransferase family protein n=1 Tax=uncultured Altererythrobacter sp. TaxID=500840 RepID=UPI000D7B665E|nr:nucleotidyltransferase family protein [uncultured Altererythrobacter sp.]PWL25476.1 MAG: hypothetical protein DCO98_03940 [Altererythrobacter sp. XM-24bin4]